MHNKNYVEWVDFISTTMLGDDVKQHVEIVTLISVFYVVIKVLHSLFEALPG